MKTKKNLSNKLIFTKLIGFLAVIMGVVQIITANLTAASGIKVQNYDLEMQNLILENKKLNNEITQNTSLSVIEKKAQKTGFTEKTAYLFLSQPLPIAYNNK